MRPYRRSLICWVKVIFRFEGGGFGVLATFFSIGRRLDVVRLAEKLQLMGIRRRAI